MKQKPFGQTIYGRKESGMKYIRKATEQDVSRIAEILVFNNRMNYWPIFQDDTYSFGELQVLPVAQEYQTAKGRLEHTLVYDDGIVKGMIWVEWGEIKKLYVDTFFQGEGIGAKLLEYAVEKQEAEFLWALEKNGRAIEFYQRHGFCRTKERMFEEGTTEYLVRLRRDNKSSKMNC